MKYLLFLALCAQTSFILSTFEKNEIELKFKVENAEQFQEFKKSFEFGKWTYLQMEETYLFGHTIQPIITESGYKKMGQYLRLRKDSEGNHITLKKRTNSGVIEQEADISDISILKGIFSALGYDDSVELKKNRKRYTVGYKKHSIEVVFDSFDEPAVLENLGEFIEVELKSNVKSVEKGINVLKSFLKERGLTTIKKYPPYIELTLNREYQDQIEIVDL